MDHKKRKAPNPGPRVFISYSHDSQGHIDRVLDLANRLLSDEIDVKLDQFESSPSEGWPQWMRNQIENADFILVVCSGPYRKRFEGREDPQTGLGASWEGGIMTQLLYEAKKNDHIIPISLDQEGASQVPTVLRSATLYKLDSNHGYRSLHERLAGRSQPRIPTPGPPSQPGRASKKMPRPQYNSDRQRRLAEELEEAFRQHQEVVIAEGDVRHTQERIVELKRKIRDGGRLRAGDYLCDSRYRLLDLIGQGGFSNVYKGYDTHDHRLVAIKVLHGQFAEDRTRRERFYRGAHKMRSLQHQGIVDVLANHLEEDGYYFFIMEYIEGGDLQRAARSPQLTIQDKLEILQQVAEALDYAHKKGIIHRDIKPANILLTKNGRAKLTDFDLVRAFDTTGGTRTGSILGTFIYMAPEAMAESKNAELPADLFSFAMTALFLLLGTDIPSSVFRNSHVVISSLPYPAEVRRVLAKGISWDPGNRYASAKKLTTALKRAFGNHVGATAYKPPKRTVIVHDDEEYSPHLASILLDHSQEFGIDDVIFVWRSLELEKLLPLISRGLKVTSRPDLADYLSRDLTRVSQSEIKALYEHGSVVIGKNSGATSVYNSKLYSERADEARKNLNRRSNAVSVFGEPYVFGVNETALERDANGVIEIMSPIVHALLSIVIKPFEDKADSNRLLRASFLCLESDKSAGGPKVFEHFDPDFGIREVAQAHRVLKNSGKALDIFGSRATIDHEGHIVRFSLETSSQATLDQFADKLESSPGVVFTDHLSLANAIDLLKDPSPPWPQVTIARHSLAIGSGGRALSGFAFVPLYNGVLLSSLSASLWLIHSDWVEVRKRLRNAVDL